MESSFEPWLTKRKRDSVPLTGTSRACGITNGNKSRAGPLGGGGADVTCRSRGPHRLRLQSCQDADGELFQRSNGWGNEKCACRVQHELETSVKRAEGRGLSEGHERQKASGRQAAAGWGRRI